MSLKLFLNNTAKKQPRQTGFSLLELVIALMVLMVLMVVTVTVVQNQREYDRLLHNTHDMENIHSALMTFVKTNGFLPCPDTSGDGKENREAIAPFACSFERGRLPFLELGLSAGDAWRQPFFYAVNTRTDSSGVLDIADAKASASYFNNQNSPQPFFNVQTRPFGEGDNGAGNYGICGEQTPSNLTTCSSSDLIESAAIAVVVSFGQNGAATWAELNGGASAGLNNAEAENIDKDQFFWKAAGSERSGARFDDQLIWITAWDIKSAIISSGGRLDLTPP